MSIKAIKLILVIFFWLTLTACSTKNQWVTQKTQEVIKAWYLSYTPWFIVDPNTKQKSWIFYDVIEKIGERSNKIIEYKEVTWSTMIESLNTNRVDIIASPVRITEPRKVAASFTEALYDSPIWAYVRNDDIRFDNSLKDINDPSVRIAAVDGEWWEVIAKELFPDANTISLPNSVDLSQLLLEVAAGKADVTFIEPVYAYEYMQQNPGKLKNVAEGANAVKNRPNAFMIRKGDSSLQAFINKWIKELVEDWSLDKIIDMYEPFTGSVTRIH